MSTSITNSLSTNWHPFSRPTRPTAFAEISTNEPFHSERIVPNNIHCLGSAE